MTLLHHYHRLFAIFLITLYLFCYVQPQIVTFTDNSTSTTNATMIFGCKTFNNGVCQQCLDNYIFNSQGVCSFIDPNCLQYNIQVGICENCHDGYTIFDGKCVSNSTQNTDPGCKKLVNNKCLQCSQRWYFGRSGKCQKVDDNCRTWNNTGSCLSCYNGYQLNQGKCLLQASNETIVNPLCKTWKNKVCIQCSFRAFFNSKNICQEVNPNCNTWDKFSGICLSCYQGYNLISGDCIVQTNTNGSSQIDPLCKKFDWQKKICLECSQRSFKNAQGRCTEVSPLCNTFNELRCLSCYSGYTLNDGQCVINKSSQPDQPTDPGCSNWDWQNQICIKCSYRFYFNSQKICTKVSDSCNTFNSDSGNCTSCYSGYQLSNGQCLQQTNTNNSTNSTDANCQRFQLNTNICIQCSYRYVFNANKVCIKVSDYCKTWDTNGSCTSCYQNYVLNSGNCTVGSLDPNCISYNINSNICITCSSRYFISSSGICTKISDLCATYDNSTGFCLSCYSGYSLSNGVCILSNQAIPQGCAYWNQIVKQCQLCSSNYCLNDNNKLCQTKPNNCQTCDYQGGCYRCNSGYKLSGSQCVSDTTNGCKESQNGKCTLCYQNQLLFNGVCLTSDNIIQLLQYCSQSDFGSFQQLLSQTNSSS